HRGGERVPLRHLCGGDVKLLLKPGDLRIGTGDRRVSIRRACRRGRDQRDSAGQRQRDNQGNKATEGSQCHGDARLRSGWEIEDISQRYAKTPPHPTPAKLGFASLSLLNLWGRPNMPPGMFGSSVRVDARQTPSPPSRGRGKGERGHITSTTEPVVLRASRSRCACAASLRA